VACDLAHKAADIQLRHAQVRAGLAHNPACRGRTDAFHTAWLCQQAQPVMCCHVLTCPPHPPTGCQTDAAATSARSLADGQLSTAEAACDRQRRLQQAARQRQRQQLMDSTHIDLHAPRGPAAPTAGVTASPGSPFGLHRPAVRPDSRLADYGPRPAGRGQLPPGSSTSMRPAGGSMSTGRLSPVVTRARTWFDSPLAGQCAGTSTPSIFEGGTSTPAYAASMRGPLPPAAHAVGSSIGSPSRQYRFASPTRQYSPGSPSRQYMAIAGSPLRQHADRGSSYYHSARTRLFQTGSDNAGSGAESGGAWQSVTSSRAGMSDVGPAGWAATVTDQLQMVAQKAAAEAAALGAAAAEQHGKLQQASDAASAAVAEVSVTAEPFLASAEWLLEGQQQYVEALVLPLLSQAQQLLGQLGSTCPSSSSSGQAAALIRPPAAAAAAASAGQEGATGSFLSACPPAVSSRTAAAACWGYLFPGAGGQADSLASRLAQGCSSSGAHSRGCTPLARPWLHSPAATPLSTATRHGACSNSSSIGGGGGIPSIMWGDSCWAPPCPTHPPRPGPHLLDVDFASHSLDWLLRQQAGQAVDGQLEAADARIGRIEQLQGRFGMENLAGARAAANQARKGESCSLMLRAHHAAAGSLAGQGKRGGRGLGGGVPAPAVSMCGRLQLPITALQSLLQHACRMTKNGASPPLHRPLRPLAACRAGPGVGPHVRGGARGPAHILGHHQHLGRLGPDPSHHLDQHQLRIWSHPSHHLDQHQLRIWSHPSHHLDQHQLQRVQLQLQQRQQQQQRRLWQPGQPQAGEEAGGAAAPRAAEDLSVSCAGLHALLAGCDHGRQQQQQQPEQLLMSSWHGSQC
jgi:hypothetical protein